MRQRGAGAEVKKAMKKKQSYEAKTGEQQEERSESQRPQQKKAKSPSILLNLMISFQPDNLRSGVTHSAIKRNRSVHTPVSCVMSWIGFALSVPMAKATNSKMNGMRHARNTPTLTNARGFNIISP